MTFEQGAIVLVPFPFTDLSSSKQRPALVLRSDRTEPDLVVCAITSQLNDAPSGAEFLVPPQELSSWGLPKPSKVKMMVVEVTVMMMMGQAASKATHPDVGE